MEPDPAGSSASPGGHVDAGEAPYVAAAREFAA
ncbi:NUDIX hydrolase [Streptomyces virginiae]